MASLNKVIFIGHLGKDPESRQAGDTSVCNFSIAMSEVWKNKDGEKQEKTEWANIVCWGQLGENCQKYLSKGKMVYIEGKYTTRKWEDKDGNTRYTTEVVARDVKFLSPKSEGSSSSSGSPSDDYDGQGFGGGGGTPDDDIPF